MKDYRYTLAPYEGRESREQCPSCGHDYEFTRYRDSETGELLPEHVGRCNRELNCGYHYPPRLYFEETGTKPDKGQIKKVHLIQAGKPIDFIALEDLEKSIGQYQNNNLYLYFVNQFGEKVTIDVFDKYCIGTSNYWKGATIFWQIDNNGNVRQCKIMLYDPVTGKRVRAGTRVQKFNPWEKQFETELAIQDCVLINGKYLNGNNKDLNLQQCFFGEHLLKQFPDKTVAIVESEKTAMIANVYLQEYVWIATGGTHGCKWGGYDVTKVFENRQVILFPDASVTKGSDKRTAYEKWLQRAQVIHSEVECKIHVSAILERYATEEQKKSGWDIADYLVTKKNHNN